MSDFLATHNRLAAMHGYGPLEPDMPKSPKELVADRITDYILAGGDDLVGFIVGCLQGWTPPATNDFKTDHVTAA